MLGKLIARLKGWLRRPADYVEGEWNRMAPRERKLLSVLAGAVGAAVFLIAGFFVYQSILDLEERNEAAREALSLIARRRGDYLDAKSKMQAQEARIGAEKPQIEADLETAAREVGIQIPETQPQQPVPANKRYLEYNVAINLRSVDLQSLAKFLHKVETGRRLIVIKKMQIRPRLSERDKMDVNLTATAWERVKETAAPKRRPGGGPIPAPAKEPS